MNIIGELIVGDGIEAVDESDHLLALNEQLPNCVECGHKAVAHQKAFVREGNTITIPYTECEECPCSEYTLSVDRRASARLTGSFDPPDPDPADIN